MCRISHGDTRDFATEISCNFLLLILAKKGFHKLVQRNIEKQISFSYASFFPVQFYTAESFVITILNLVKIPKTRSEKTKQTITKNPTHQIKQRKKFDLQSSSTEGLTPPVYEISYSNNLLTIDIIISNYS